MSISVGFGNAAGTVVAAVTLPIIWVLCGALTVVTSPLLLIWWIQHKMDWPNGWVQ